VEADEHRVVQIRIVEEVASIASAAADLACGGTLRHCPREYETSRTDRDRQDRERQQPREAGSGLHRRLLPRSSRADSRVPAARGTRGMPSASSGSGRRRMGECGDEQRRAHRVRDLVVRKLRVLRLPLVSLASIAGPPWR
jgi:hypothetical protein